MNIFDSKEIVECPTPEMILELQDIMARLPQVDCPLKHHFSPGVYAREMLMISGTAVVGKRHAHAHLLIVASGDVTILNGSGRMRVCAPMVLNSPAGVKRAIFAHEDSTLITIHLTDETDVDKIEDQVIIKESLPHICGELT